MSGNISDGEDLRDYHVLKEDLMKKRVLSLFLAFVLSFSMMPMSAFAEEAGTVTEQEAQSGEDTVEVFPTGEDTVGVSTSGEDTVEVPTTGEDISGGNAVTKDAAVEAAQSLIDALPEEVTAENADGLQAQLMAIDEALAALDEEQTAKLDMTRLENICVALTTFVAAQDGEHADHPICGLTCTHENKHDAVTEWEPISNATALKATQAGHHYYLTSDVTLTSGWTVNDNIVLCLNGHSIKQTGDDMVIYVQTGVTFSLCDCSRGDNAIEANGNYFVNAVEASGVFNMYGGVIRGSSKKGGVEVAKNNGSTFNMYGGEISGNKWGVDVKGSVTNSGTFNMYGGIICNNKRGSEEGGGVVVEENAIFNMSGGEISSNSANTGGGVCMKRSAAGFTMTGGEITKNSAQNGGGVYVGESSKFIMTGGEISGNTATKNGGGVYVDGTYGVLTVSGAPKITGNTVSNTASNVLLSNNYKTITIGEGGLNSDAKIGVTVQSFPTTKASPVQFPAAGTDVTLTRTDAKAFFIDNNTDNTYSVQLIDNKLYVYYGDLHRHPICGDVSCTDSSHQADVDWTGVSTLTNSMTAGYYYLTADVTVQSWTPLADIVLCLNGHSITGQEDFSVIDVPKNTTFTLTDCNGSVGKRYFRIDENKDRWVSCEESDDGSFPVEGGVITRAVSCEQSGVLVEHGTFKMYGGTICGHGGHEGAGVLVNLTDSVFEMYGGAIKGNNAGTNKRGGGVYVYKSTFTMTGGTISDNKASSGGGVCWLDGTFNVNGTPVISGNKNADGAVNNVYVYNSNLINIKGMLDEGAKIGVSTSKTPTAETPVQIAAGASGSRNYTEIFKPDVTNQGYVVVQNGTGLYLSAHKHNWTYKKSADGKTITASCDAGNCPTEDGGSVTIKAPAVEPLTYDGKAKAAMLVGKFTNGESKPEISYKDKDGNEITEPINAGTYTASITLGGVTASVTYEIAKATPKADDFTFTAPSDLTYDGSAKFATIKTLEGINGMGEFTWKYKQGQTGKMVSEPTDADTYTVVISVAEGDNYKLADNLSSAAWMFEIQRNSTTPIVELSENKTYTYTGSEIQPRVTVKTIDGKTLVEGTDYRVSYGENKDAGKGTIIVDGLGNYSFKNVVKSFPIEKAEQPMHFEQESVDDKTYSDCGEFVTNPLTRTVVAGAVTYSSSNEDVATVDSDGIAAIVGVGTATITATAGETENYKTGTATYTLTVGKAHLRVNEAPSVDSKDYDGKTDAEVTVFFVNEKDRPVTLAKGTDYTVTGTFRSPDASDSEQTVDVEITLSEDCARNYELETDTYTASGYINKRPISIESASAVDRDYKQDNCLVEISGVTFKGVVEGKELEKDIDYEVTGEIYDDNAGTKDVDVTVTLIDKAAKNYSLEGNTGTQTTVKIKQATPVITVAALEQTIVKNGAAVYISDWASINNTDDSALTYELVGTPAGITLDGVSLTAENAASTVSSFEIKVTAKATMNFTEPEEKIITVKVTDKADADVRITGETADKTYGDKDFTLKATKTAPDGGTWSWSSDASGVLEISGADTDTPTINVKKAGTAILTVTYISDDYYGSDSVSIIVNRKAVTADMIADIPAQEYTGSAIEPDFEVKDGTTLLNPGADFTYNYSGNTNPGTATLTITGKGNYTGTASRDFTISPRSIKGAMIVLDAESFAYTGTEQTVSITSVTLSDGTVLGACDYVIKDNSNKATNASDSIILTIEGRGNYTGTATTTWKITKIAPELKDFVVTPEDLTTALTYDGKAKTVNVTTADGIQGMGKITVKYNGSTQAPTNAGNYEVTFEAADGMNYNAGTFNVGTLTIKKADAPTLKDIEAGYKYTLTGVKTVELTDLVANATGYKLGAITGDTDIISDSSVDANGVLKYTLTGKGGIGDTVTLPVTITSVNYEDTTVKVVITLKAKDDQTPLSITGGNTVVYGQTLTLGTTGGSGTGAVTYHISTELGDGAAAIEGNILTPVKVGRISITATKAADDDYLAAVSAPVVITITQAVSTGKPKYTVITTDGKTLADAGLTLADSTIFPTEGTLEWIDSEDKVLSGETVVEMNKTYKWRFTPADGNYASLTGEVELYHVDAPVISSQPVGASVKTGERATFKVTATGTDVAYQWMIDRNDGNGFVAVNGADSAGYTTGVTDLDCNGFRYYCIIRNAAGSVTTDIVTLTVSENIIPTPSPTPTPTPQPSTTPTPEPSTTPTPEPSTTPTPTPESSPTPDRNAYKIIDGADSKWTQNTDGTLAIRGDGAFAKFRSVKVDGNLVDPSNYTVTEGSTIITLKADYLKTLSEGSHTFELVWTDGSASTNFTIAAKPDNGDNNNDSNDDSENDITVNGNVSSGNNTVPAVISAPKTGDASGIWMTLFAVSLAGLAAMLVRKKNNRE